jgi:AraC-like DNA-binding protein
VEGLGSPRIPLRHITDWEALIVKTGFSLAALAKECGISPRHLQRYAKAVFKKRLGSYIRQFRLAHAHARLLNGERIKEVALNLGYKHVSHFSRCFRKHYGYCASAIPLRTPDEIRNSSEQMELNIPMRISKRTQLSHVGEEQSQK